MRRRKEATHPTDDQEPEAFLPLPHLPFQVLLALAEEPRHGGGVIRRIEELSEGRESPSSGSLYLAMSRLEKRGLLEDVPAPESETDTRRRYLRPTPLGRRVLAAETERMAGLVDVSRRSLGGERGPE